MGNGNSISVNTVQALYRHCSSGSCRCRHELIVSMFLQLLVSLCIYQTYFHYLPMNLLAFSKVILVLRTYRSHEEAPTVIYPSLVRHLSEGAPIEKSAIEIKCPVETSWH